MADETNNAQAGDQEKATTQGASDETGLVSDLTKVDPKVLQSEIDKAVQKAIRTREENLTRKQQEERAEQERAAAEQRGEYERIKAEMAAEKDRLRQELVVKDTMFSLREIARDAGLLDMDDLALLRGEAVAEAVDENGSVDPGKLKELVERFKNDKPHKFRQAEAGDSRRASRIATPTPPDSKPGETHKHPNWYKEEALDAYTQKRNEQLERLRTFGRGGSDPALDAIARALQGRLKE